MIKNSYVRTFVLLVILILFQGCANFKNIRKAEAGVEPAAKNFLTIMSYNIRVGYGSKDFGVDPYVLSRRKKSLPPIVAAIQSIDPDIVGLQEVYGSSQAHKLAKTLNMNFAYEGHATGSSRPSWWGVAVLSKYPILNAEGIQISSGRGNTKSALICTVDFGGQPTTFISIHKDKDLKDGSSFEVIMRSVERIKGPVVLIGDLNMYPHDPRLKLLQGRFIDTAMAVDTAAAKNARNTGTFLGFGRIDYVFVDSQYFAVQDAGIISREHWSASDHIACYARVTLKP